MLDLIVAKVVSKLNEKMDPEIDSETSVEKETSPLWTVWKIISNILSVYAAVIAWRCNTDSSPVARVLWSIIAWIFGLVYLAYFYLVKTPACTMMVF